MEIEEEEVKWEAAEPQKALLTLGLRNRREPEHPLKHTVQFSLHAGWRRLQKSDIKHTLHELASGNNQTVPEFPREDQLPSLASRNTQQPLPELQANDNRLENLDPSVFRQDDSKIELPSMNDNDVNQEISKWTLLMTNLILEIASAVFDQMGYALIGMVLAFVALLLAAVELMHMVPKERIKRAGKRPILPCTSATTKPVGTVVECFGLVGAVWQCVYSTVEYTYTRQEKDNPIKMCLLPSIFLLCVVISKLLVDKRSIDESS
ncbi:hypothetical protein POTOM_000061 [Populus tomentosa]|uniref:Uncharacterized protein n=1 Tax=Populus tomentosa TaxID=118781 RepID=A0A8X8AQK0_POPTO|nr:hypothetical protein POTOM_000061 [Populus tomentosa]